MSIEFEADQYERRDFKKKTTPIAGWFVKVGLAENDKQANWILIILSIVALVAILIIAL